MLGTRRYNQVAIDLYHGDITDFVCDAMVNAANPELAGGDGVDGAIHRVGGASILRECQEKYPGGCPTGSAVVTGAGELPARWLIHTVGPVWLDGRHDEERLLRSAYQSSLRLAVTLGARHVAFPSISTGAYGYPIDKAASIAMHAIRDFLGERGSLGRITFVLFNAEHYRTYQKSLYATFPEDGLES